MQHHDKQWQDLQEVTVEIKEMLARFDALKTEVDGMEGKKLELQNSINSLRTEKESLEKAIDERESQSRTHHERMEQGFAELLQVLWEKMGKKIPEATLSPSSGELPADSTPPGKIA